MKAWRRTLLPWGLAGLLAVSAYAVAELATEPAAVPSSLADLGGGESGWMYLDSGDVGVGGLAAEKPEIHPRQIVGRLTLPDGPGPFPAAVLLHGSLGLGDLQFDYAGRLLEAGFAVFLLDSFATRGLSDVVGDQLAIPAQTMTIDAYSALNLLSTHPSVRQDRIALIGWSKGGGVAQLAMKRQYRDLLAKDDLRFAAHVAFYPWCGEQDAELDMTESPILFVLAGRDDWVDPQSCRDYADRLEGEGHKVRVAEFPSAEHGFDHPGSYRRYIARAKAWGRCRYFVRASGFVIAATGEFRPWKELKEYFSDCVGHGAHIGANDAARSAARELLPEFLRATLKASSKG